MEILVHGRPFTETLLPTIIGNPDKPIYCIDGDVVIYAIASRCQTIRWGVVNRLTDVEVGIYPTKTEANAKLTENPEEWIIMRYLTVSNLRDTINAIDMYLDQELSRAMPIRDSMKIMCVTHGTTFRHQLYTEYKAHRKEENVPHWVGPVREALAAVAGGSTTDNEDLLKSLIEYWKQALRKRNIFAAWMPFAEADDAMSIIVNAAGASRCVIVSTDKDLVQTGACVHDFIRHVNIETTPEEANRFLAKQALMGDSVDGIPGLPDIADVRSEKMLDAWVEENPDIFHDEKQVYAKLLEEYQKHKKIPEEYTPEEYLLLMYRLVRLLRTTDEIKDIEIGA